MFSFAFALIPCTTTITVHLASRSDHRRKPREDLRKRRRARVGSARRATRPALMNSFAVSIHDVSISMPGTLTMQLLMTRPSNSWHVPDGFQPRRCRGSELYLHVWTLEALKGLLSGSLQHIASARRLMHCRSTAFATLSHRRFCLVQGFGEDNATQGIALSENHCTLE